MNSIGLKFSWTKELRLRSNVIALVAVKRGIVVAVLSTTMVTFIEALDQLMPGFDPEIGKLAQRVLINPRRIDHQTGVFAKKITPAKDEKPVIIKLINAKTEIL